MIKLINKNLLLKLIPLSFFTCIDGLSSVGFIWILLEKYHSIFDLGVCLSVSSFLSFFLQKKSNIIKKIIFSNSNLFFMIQSCFCIFYSFIILFEIYNNSFSKILIMISLIFYSVFIFMNYFVIDTFLSKIILNNELSSTQGSVISQVIMQFGAIFGFAIGGKVFSAFGIQGTIKSIIVLLIICLLFGVMNLFRQNINVQKLHKIEDTSVKENTFVKSNFYSWVAVFGIFMISIQLANFNLFLPGIFLKYKNWSPETFGFISGVASLGAFIASFVVYKGKTFLLSVIAAASIIPIANLTLSFSKNTTICLVLAFLLGFSVNSLRSTFRKNIFENLSSTQDISKWISLSNLLTFLPRALFPLIVSLLIGNSNIAKAFPLIGIFIAFFIVITTVFTRVKYQNNKTQIINRS